MTTRKKGKRNTSSRRRSHHHRSRLTKRGGMIPRSLARTMIYHRIRPLFTKFKDHIGRKEMTPEEKAVVVAGERYFKTFADIPADDPLKASISELKKEWSKTENKAEKALGFYNKLIQTLKDADTKKRRHDDRLRHLGERHADGVFASSSASSILSPSLASIGSLSSLRRDPYSSTPGFVKRSNAETPQKPTGEEKGSRSVLTPSTVRSFAMTSKNLNNNPIRALDFDADDDYDGAGAVMTSPSRSPPRSPPRSRSPMKSPPRLRSKTRSQLRDFPLQ